MRLELYFRRSEGERIDDRLPRTDPIGFHLLHARLTSEDVRMEVELEGPAVEVGATVRRCRERGIDVRRLGRAHGVGRGAAAV